MGWLVVKLFRARLVGERPSEFPCVVVGAPHTTNWDYVMMIGVAWSNGLSPFWLGKKELFASPVGFVFRWTRGIPVDRDDPSGLVEDILGRAKTHEEFLVVIAPEGTRSGATHWKSGFRRIARSGGMPVTLAFSRGPDRTCGFGPTLHPTDDVVADMDRIREFFADKPGLRPENKITPRLREEDAAAEGDTTADDRRAVEPPSGAGGLPPEVDPPVG